MHPYHDQARTLVGCAVGHVFVGTAEDVLLAKRAITRAVTLFMQSGLTREQALRAVIAHTEILGGLE